MSTTEVMVDSNVILDLITKDPNWYDWSFSQIEELGDSHILVINQIIYSEISISFNKIEELDEFTNPAFFRKDSLPWEAGFLASKCFYKYRKQGGQKRSPLPDFYIGAHAAITGMKLLTRDKGRYKTYFPKLEVISP